jgi:hypothetical protein
MPDIADFTVQCKRNFILQIAQLHVSANDGSQYSAGHETVNMEFPFFIFF